MTTQASLYRKLWTLADEERQAGRFPLSEHLLERLEADFTKKKLFSKEEYRDPAFREILLVQGGRDAFSISKDVTSLVQAILGPGKILNLYSGLGEFLYAFGKGIGVEPQTMPAKWSRFLARIAGVEAQVVNEDPLNWSSTERFERIICSPPFGMAEIERKTIEKALSVLAGGDRSTEATLGCSAVGNARDDFFTREGVCDRIFAL